MKCSTTCFCKGHLNFRIGYLGAPFDYSDDLKITRMFSIILFHLITCLFNNGSSSPEDRISSCKAIRCSHYVFIVQKGRIMKKKVVFFRFICISNRDIGA